MARTKKTGIAYQNKDITSKIFGERLKNEYLDVNILSSLFFLTRRMVAPSSHPLGISLCLLDRRFAVLLRHKLL